MNRYPANKAGCFWALFLSLCLSLPSPAFALRVQNGGLEERTPTILKLEAALLGDNPVEPTTTTGGLEEDPFLSTREFKLLLATLYLKRGINEPDNEPEMNAAATNLLRTSGPITAPLHIAFLETALETLGIDTTKALAAEATKQLSGVTEEDLNRAVAIADSFGKKSSYETAVQPLLQLKNRLAASIRPSSLPSPITPETYWQTEAGFNTYLQAISGSEGSIYQQAYENYVEILYALADGQNTTQNGQSITYHAVLEALAYLTQFAGSVSTETDVNMLLDRVSTLNLRIFSLVGRTDDNYGYPNKLSWLGWGQNFDVLERVFRDREQRGHLIQEAQRAPVIALPVPLLDVESEETETVKELWASHDTLYLKSRIVTTPIDETDQTIREADTPIHKIVTRVFAALPQGRLGSPFITLEHPTTNWSQAVLRHQQVARLIQQTVSGQTALETMAPSIQKLFSTGLEENRSALQAARNRFSDQFVQPQRDTLRLLRKSDRITNATREYLPGLIVEMQEAGYPEGILLLMPANPLAAASLDSPLVTVYVHPESEGAATVKELLDSGLGYWLRFETDPTKAQILIGDEAYKDSVASELLARKQSFLVINGNTASSVTVNLLGRLQAEGYLTAGRVFYLYTDLEDTTALFA